MIIFAINLIFKVETIIKNKIKEVIKEQGISQKELCKMVGMSEAGMSNAINGSASKETLQKIADALKIDVSDLRVEEGLYAKYSADKTPLKLGQIEIPCYVLNNGMRVFSGRGIQKALGPGDTSVAWLSKFVNSYSVGNNLTTEVLEKFNSPIKFQRNHASGSQLMT